MKYRHILTMAATATMICVSAVSSPAIADDIVGIVIKHEGNPFFVKMKETALARGKELGLDVRAFAGKSDGDSESQVAAIEALIASGAKGILITPAESSVVVPAIQAARDAGILVIALDTPLEPIDSADATFATDNFKAGELIGEWANGFLADNAKNAKIAFLDLAPSQPSVDYLRNQGFMTGFGIDVKDPKRIGDEDDPRICGHDVTGGGEEGGRKAMENLLQLCPDTNLVYAISETAAAGAWEALKSVGKDDGTVVMVAIDGGCPGVRNVADGALGATAQQYPHKMALLGVDAVAEFIKTGKKPEKSPGLEFTDTGAALVTAKPVEGLPSIDVEEGIRLCWG